jgi:hypothetical protein
MTPGVFALDKQLLSATVVRAAWKTSRAARWQCSTQRGGWSLLQSMTGHAACSGRQRFWLELDRWLVDPH